MGTGSGRSAGLLTTIVVAMVAIVASFLGVPAASAEPTDPPVSEVVLVGPPTGTKRAPATFTVRTRYGVGDDAGPAAGVHVVLEGRTGTGWTVRATGVSDQSGQVEITAQLDDRDTQTYQARTTPPQGEPVTSKPIEVAAVNQTGDIAVELADQVADGDTTPLSISWRTSTGLPVPGRVHVHRLERGIWTIESTLTLSASGTATMTVAPRWDSTWYVAGEAGTWYDAARSANQVLDNVPPGLPVAYPSYAPVPTVVVPEQPRATTPGASPVVTRIPTKLWRSMVGVSWHRGCPIGRARLRLLRINYWGFDGYRHQGRLVAAAGVMPKFRRALVELYNRRYPIRSMYLAEHFGYSATLGGADDFASMAADNTSAFNCRRVVNARRISPHSYGRSIDVNPWENPYYSAKGLVPNTWWSAWSWAPITARTRTDLLVRVFARHGVRWTYGTRDAQHFDG